MSTTDRLSPDRSSRIAESLILTYSNLFVCKEISSVVDVCVLCLKTKVMPQGPCQTGFSRCLN